jgi:hypothetical protein
VARIILPVASTKPHVARITPEVAGIILQVVSIILEVPRIKLQVARIIPHFATIIHFTNCGGALDLFIDNAHIDELFPGKKYSWEKFTFQMSDHLPIWIQVKTDIEGFRLNQIVRRARNNYGEMHCLLRRSGARDQNLRLLQAS